MTDPAVTAKQLVDLARKHIEDQQRRIARQRELMASMSDDVARMLSPRYRSGNRLAPEVNELGH